MFPSFTLQSRFNSTIQQYWYSVHMATVQLNTIKPEKEIKKLCKKLDQIAKLKERVAAGEKLEINQVII